MALGSEYLWCWRSARPSVPSHARRQTRERPRGAIRDRQECQRERPARARAVVGESPLGRGLAAGTLTVPASQIASLLWEAHDVGSMTFTADAATVTAVPSSRAGAHHRRRSHGKARLGDPRKRHAHSAAAQRSAPEWLSCRTEWQAATGRWKRRASGGLFGMQASITALVKPSEGRLVAEPQGLPVRESRHGDALCRPPPEGAVSWRPTARRINRSPTGSSLPASLL